MILSVCFHSKQTIVVILMARTSVMAGDSNMVYAFAVQDEDSGSIPNHGSNITNVFLVPPHFYVTEHGLY